jgi:hypothetical protein
MSTGSIPSRPTKYIMKNPERSKIEERPKTSEEIYQSNLEDLDYIKELTNFYTKKIEKDLSRSLGQTDLSIIEKAKLREIAEETIRQKLEELILISKNEIPSQKTISTRNEILYRWLWELYDIKRSDIPGEAFGNQILNIPEDFKEYLRRLRSDSHLV